MESSSSLNQDFPTNPKMDYFCSNLVDAWLATDKTFPKGFPCTLAVAPFQTQMYGHNCKCHLPHVDFQPLAVLTHHLNHFQVHLWNSDDLGIPFYLSLVRLLLHFQKGPALWKSMHNWTCFPRTCPFIFECISPRCGPWTKHGKWDVPVLIVANLAQCAEPTSGTSPPPK